MLKFVVPLQRIMELLHAQGHALVGQRVDLLRRDALDVVVVDVLALEVVLLDVREQRPQPRVGRRGR